MSDKPPEYTSKRGRPSLYTDELAAKICEQLASGLSLKSVCEAAEMPSMYTVFLWLHKHPDFLKLYERAREQQAEAMFEEIFAICDDGSNDTYKDDEGNPRTDWDVLGRSRLRVDTRKWALARMSPKRFGDKTTTDLNVTDTNKPLSDEQIATRVQAIFDRAKARSKSDITDLI